MGHLIGFNGDWVPIRSLYLLHNSIKEFKCCILSLDVFDNDVEIAMIIVEDCGVQNLRKE